MLYILVNELRNNLKVRDVIYKLCEGSILA